MLTLTEMQRQIKLKEWELRQQEQELREDIDSRPVEFRGLPDNMDKAVSSCMLAENAHNMELAKSVASALGVTVAGYFRLLLRQDLIERGYEPSLEYKGFPSSYNRRYDYPARLLRERLSFYLDEVPLTKQSDK